MKSFKFNLALAASVFVVMFGALSSLFTLDIVAQTEPGRKLQTLARLASANQLGLSLTPLSDRPATRKSIR
jgi:hypothetical protein